jgi:hypothetical protein
MASRDEIRALIDRLLDARDPYAALGAYPFADEPARRALEEVILATPRLRLTFAAAPYAPADLLEGISIEANAATCLRLAKNPATPPSALARLLTGDASDRIRRYVAAHPRASAAMLSALAGSPSIEVRRAVAGNPNAPGDVLARLVAEGDGLIDRNAAVGPFADAGLLQTLWDTGERHVRAEVAAHPNCPGAVLEQAEAMADALIRRKLASNPALRSAALTRLLADDDERVRAAAVRNPTVSGEFFDDPEGDPSPRVRRIFARRESWPGWPPIRTAGCAGGLPAIRRFPKIYWLDLRPMRSWRCAALPRATRPARHRC